MRKNKFNCFSFLIARNIFSLWLVLFFLSCESDIEKKQEEEIQPEESGIYILNEGLWGNNNSSISYVGLNSDKIISDIVSENWKRKLGDTGNSFYEKNDTVFVCVTSSNKIEIFRKSTGEFINSYVFPQNTEPRNSVRVDDKLFVTSFKLGSVIAVDLKTLSQTKIISVGDHPEQIVYENGKLLISISGLGSGNSISVVDPVSGTEIKEIRVGLNPAEIIVLPNFIVVHCSGNLLIDNPKSTFYRLRKTDFSVYDSIQTGKQIHQVGLYGNENIFFVENENVVTADENITSQTVLFPRSLIHSKIIYSSLYDSKKGIMWIASTDAYTVRGWLEGFKNGVKVYGSFQVGINPGDLLVK